MAIVNQAKPGEPANPEPGALWSRANPKRHTLGLNREVGLQLVFPERVDKVNAFGRPVQATPKARPSGPKLRSQNSNQATPPLTATPGRAQVRFCPGPSQVAPIGARAVRSRERMGPHSGGLVHSWPMRVPSFDSKETRPQCLLADREGNSGREPRNSRFQLPFRTCLEPNPARCEACQLMLITATTIAFVAWLTT